MIKMENKRININIINLINDLNGNLYTKIVDHYNINKSNKIYLNSEQNMIHESSRVQELKMHKILYFLYGNFYSKYKKELFKANFQAWKYGPVEIDYRKEIKKEQNSFEKFNVEISTEELEYIKYLIETLLKNSTFELVNASHFTDPWKKYYKGDESKWQKIPKKDIQDFFQNKGF